MQIRIARAIAGNLIAIPTMLTEFMLGIYACLLVLVLPISFLLGFLILGVEGKLAMWPYVFAVFFEAHFLSPYPLWLEMSFVAGAFALLYSFGWLITPAEDRSLYREMNPIRAVKSILKPP